MSLLCKKNNEPKRPLMGMLKDGLYHKQVYGRRIFIAGNPYLLPEDLRNSGHVYVLIRWPKVFLSDLMGTPFMELTKSETGVARATL